MKANIDKFDFFVRTNLSTFVIQSRRQSYVELQKNYRTHGMLLLYTAMVAAVLGRRMGYSDERKCL
jgi:hypothetical protein